MRFVADLHVHSRHSRATSRDADLAGYLRWARAKGIRLVGTGDFTHPGWIAEIAENLEEGEPGLLRFRSDPGGSALSAGRPQDIPVRFLLTAEISSIYRKRGAVRKVHSIVMVPGLEEARRLGARLAAIGNVASDGRPILGLDPKDLLSILLETSPRGLLIPAHVWTPWFSLFGSKSGFDAIEDCFEELTPLIPALETGLSSDPAMNRRWSALDRFRLVSNSDAHSPPKLGREANLLDTEMSYDGVHHALTTGEGFLGTYEFYPEEGKYHADGHRACGVRMEPEETARRAGLCPVCGKPLTVGVLNRVLSLADRPPAQPGERGFRYLIPLPEILAELHGTGSGARGVTALYERLVSTFGSEYAVLFDAPREELRAGFGDLLAEALGRMRDGRVHPEAGFDGEFGVIRVFEAGELERLRGQDVLFGGGRSSAGRKEHALSGKAALAGSPAAGAAFELVRERQPDALDPEQEAASRHADGAALVAAGPGTGKTRVLARWIARLLAEGKAGPRDILAVTFTNRAADELRARLAAAAGEAGCAVTVATFHSFCFTLHRERDPSITTVYGPEDREEMLRLILAETGASAGPGAVRAAAARVERQLEGTGVPDAGLQTLMERYRGMLAAAGAVDISALVAAAARGLAADPPLLSRLRARIRFVAVDELQDINPAQFELLRLLAAPPGPGEQPRSVLCIGDPDQAIYGFRGSDRSLFRRFAEETGAALVTLANSYRSHAGIVRAASGVLAAGSPGRRAPLLRPVRPAGAAIRIQAAEDPADEGRLIAEGVRSLVGGVDSISADAGSDGGYSFGDVAVLFRTRAVRDALLPSLLRAGLPLTFRDSAPLCAEGPFLVLASALRVLWNPADAAAAARLRAPAAREAIEALTVSWRETLEAQGVAGLVEEVLRQVAVPDMSDPRNLIGAEVVAETARGFGDDLEGFLRRLSLLTLESEGGLRSERVRLLTFHAAKGLEFPVVFIAGAEEGITPMPDDLEEERRLFYVALTRAGDRLFISHCARRTVHGTVRAMSPSRFLSDIPADCREAAERTPRRKTTDRQLPLFG
jgi:DNA helicase II / ATP-dependent DNA helicase PcrA